MAKPRVVYRTRTVYRDRQPNDDEQTTTATASVITTSKVNGWIGSITIADMKQWLQVMIPLAVFWWAYLGPLVESKAEELLVNKLVEIGADPATLQAINKNLTDLQVTVKERDESAKQLSEDVGELKSQLGTVLKLMELQVLKGAPNLPLEDAAK